MQSRPVHQPKNRRLWLVVLAALTIAFAGGCQSRAKSKKEATARWNKARAGVMYSLASDQFKAGNLDQARKTVDQALKLDPANPAVLVLSAKVHVEQGQLEAGELQLEAARKAAPNMAEAYYLSGVVYQRWQKPQTAYEYYTAACDKAPAELAYVLARAEMLVALDRSNEAISLLQEKVNYFENSPAVRDAYAQLLAQAGRHTEAVEMFRQAVMLADDDLALKERFAFALFHDKQYVEAAEAFTRLLENEQYKGRADLLAALGQSQLHVGKPREARRSFEEATQKDPGNQQTWLGLAKAAMESNDFKRAELALKKAYALDKTAPDAHLLLGYLRLRQNRYPDALAAFERASAKDPKDTVSICMIGYVHEKTGKKDLAMEYYGKALQIKPNDQLASRLIAGIDLND